MPLDSTSIPVSTPPDALRAARGAQLVSVPRVRDDDHVSRMRAVWLAMPGLLLLAIHALTLRPAFIDDAFIFYRYAANWAAGLGPVFNPGERVEGYSSFLWTALLALGARLGVPPDHLGPLLSFVFAAVTLLAVSRMAGVLFPRSTSLGVALPLACALSTGFAFYSLSGMDTAIFAASIAAATLAVRSALRDGRVRGVALALPALVLVRAEGVLYALALVALFAVFARVTGGAALRRAVLWAAAATLATAVVQFGGRHLFYGSWVPSSLSSKAYATHVLGQLLAGTPGAAAELWRAFARGARYVAFLLPLFALPAAILIVRRVRREPVDPLVWCLATVIALSASVTLWAGGDWMPYHRHTVAVWCPTVVLLAWAAYDVLARSTRGRPAAWPTAAAALLLLAGGLYASGGGAQLNPSLLASARAEDPAETVMRELGAGLARSGSRVVVATNIAGKWPYVAGSAVHVRDILGLADPHNARHGAIWVPRYGRTDPEYSYGPPLDLLVTNTTGDLRQLLERASSRQAAGFVLFERPEWLENRLFVAGPADQPLTARLAAICGCTLKRLDDDRIARLKVQEFEGAGR